MTEPVSPQEHDEANASGMMPQSRDLGTQLVDHVRRARHTVDEWQKNHPGISDPRIVETRRALRVAESNLQLLASGDDPHYRAALATFRKRYLGIDDADDRARTE